MQIVTDFLLLALWALVLSLVGSFIFFWRTGRD